jgi:penicillin-binding protein 2
MLVIDELKKNDPQLRLVAIMLAGGLCILLAGLWWVQVVSARQYQSHLVTQAYRTIRVPAVRGKIMDRDGRVLAENRARYNLSLYLDDLRQPFAAAADQLIHQAITEQRQAIAAREKQLGRRLTKTERRTFAFRPGQLDALRQQARAQVAGQVVADISRKMGEPLPFDAAKFNRHYATQLAMPFVILPNLDADQIARFEENYPGGLGADLELQSERSYPYGTTAAHVLGELRQDDSSVAGEDSFFNYRLPDYRGVTGIEGKYNAVLHGRAGAESVLVNNMGYRQSEDVDSAPLPGQNVVLTLDLDIQRAAEESLVRHQGANVNAAVVVMDVHSGDVLAMASSPAFDPNDFAQGISVQKYQQLQALQAEKNRATYENYAPGSIFKTVVSLAALENGLNPAATYVVQPNPERPDKGCIYVGRRKIEDTAPPGRYDFKRAFIHSSNAYFVNAGLTTAGIENIVRVGHEFHLGERTGLFANQETPGIFPTEDQIHDGWRDGDTANLCIGQGDIDVTPIQMAVMISAIANGGTILWPRLVERIEPPDAAPGETVTNLPSGLVRDHLNVHPRSLRILREAMLADVESSEGTGTAAAVDGLQICGKTGTAQVKDSTGRLIAYNFWFASFAPYENPKYAVVVMVQSTYLHGSGGLDCAPVAHDIYEEILQKEKSQSPQTLAMRDEMKN